MREAEEDRSGDTHLLCAHHPPASALGKITRCLQWAGQQTRNKAPQAKYGKTKRKVGVDGYVLIVKPVVGGIRTHWRLLKEDQPTNQRPPTGNVTNIKDKDHHQVFHQLHQDLLQYDCATALHKFSIW